MRLSRAFASYRPPKPIPFSSGRYLLYSHPKVQNYSYVGQALLYSSTAFFGTKVLLLGAEMGWLSWLFQSGVFLGSFSMAAKLREASRHTGRRYAALKVHLKSDGKTLEIQTGLLTDLRKVTEVLIADIKPNSEEDERLKVMTKLGGFHAISTRRGETYLLWPNGFNPDLELLKKVTEGFELDLHDSDKVDIIDI